MILERNLCEPVLISFICSHVTLFCMIVCLISFVENAVSSKPRKASTLVVFHTSWCESSCATAVHAAHKLREFATITENLDGTTCIVRLCSFFETSKNTIRE